MYDHKQIMSQTIKAGEAIYGQYVGIPFTGIVKSVRNTPDYRNVIVSIKFDEPLMVFGEKRESSEIWSNDINIERGSFYYPA